MALERITYRANGTTFVGALNYDENAVGRRPLMLVAPNWVGVSDHAMQRASEMAGSKYVAFVADMYGGGNVAAHPEDAAPLANALRADVAERRRRITAALHALRNESESRGIGDLSRQVAVGFCFGGGNVLELARTGADVQAAICIHGDLLTPSPAKAGDIKAAICVLHGAQDPVVPQEHRHTFEAEMSAANAKWQMLVFGGLLHSFSEIESDVPGIARYDAGAARQTYKIVDEFATAAFEGTL